MDVQSDTLDFEVELDREGMTPFYRPVQRASIPRASDVVFYNKKQEINRTISVLVLKALFDLEDSRSEHSEVKVCEPLAATGIRGLRYLTEVDGVTRVCLNDLNPRAVVLMNKNIRHLQLTEFTTMMTKKHATVDNRDAIRHLHAHHVNHEYFDVVDIDPYGTPAPFLEASTLILQKEGILAATATDMPALVGNYPAVAYENLGVSFSSKPWFFHEFALRVHVLGMMWPGFKHGRFFKPLLSFYKDHYVRAFVKRVKGKSFVRANVGFLVSCRKCLWVQEWRPYVRGEMLEIQVCPNCNNHIRVLGPCWLGKLQDTDLLEKILSFSDLNRQGKLKKIYDFLTLLRQEEKVNLPYHYDVHLLTKSWKISAISTRKVVELLLSNGYEATLAHYGGTTFKTDAPPEVLKELLVTLT